MEGANDVFKNEVVIDNFNEGTELIKSFGMVENAYQETCREEWIDKDKFHKSLPIVVIQKHYSQHRHTKASFCF